MGDADQDWLIEILLPITYNDGSQVGDSILGKLREELVSHFGGLTAFTRSPAKGVWRSGARVSHDDVVVLEVMSDALDRKWWDEWRRRVEGLLHQAEIVIRASRIERL